MTGGASTLAVDIGNGSLKYALFSGGRRTAGGRLGLDDDFAALPGAARVAAVSVNPPALARLRAVRPDVRVVGEDVPLPLAVHYEPPGDCGPDRVLAVAGALARCPDAPGVLVLDAGTCLTATVGIRGRGVLGGAIAPGPELMAWALHAGTQALPQVTPAEPAAPIGASTAESIRVGIRAAVRGAVREIVASFRASCPTPLAVVAAGTGAGALAATAPEIEHVHPWAVLWGVFLSQSNDLRENRN